MARKYTTPGTRLSSTGPDDGVDGKGGTSNVIKPKKTNKTARHRGRRTKISAKRREHMRSELSVFQTIDGQKTNMAQNPCRTIILKGDSILLEQGYTEKRDLSFYTTKKLAVDMLMDLNYSLVPIGPRYSLVTTQTDKTTIENPNIENPRLTTDSNQKIQANKNFPNECDPFYNLDEAKPNREKENDKRRRRRAKPDLTTTAAAIVQMNFIKKEQTQLKEFHDKYAIIRSHY